MPGVRIELTTPYRRPELKSGALTTRPTKLSIFNLFFVSIHAGASAGIFRYLPYFLVTKRFNFCNACIFSNQHFNNRLFLFV